MDGTLPFRPYSESRMKVPGTEDSITGFSDMLRQALGEQLSADATGFVDMMAEDGVMEFPFAPPGTVRRLEGRAAVAAHLAGFGDILRIDAMNDLVVHRTQAPDVFVLQFGCVGQGVKTGEPYDQRYVSIITLRNGRIARYEDYWNPLVVLRAVGGVDATSAALTAGER
jgi:ketosteroid isomerase-like protein